MDAHNKRRLEACERYAAADKSDPFTLDRAKAHRNGISDSRKQNTEAFLWQGAQTYRYRVTVDGKTVEIVAASREDAIDRAKYKFGQLLRVVQLGAVGTPRMEKVTPEPYAHYDATAFSEPRKLQNGETYHVTVYRNVVRP